MIITDRFKRKETEYKYVDYGVVFKCDGEYYMATKTIESFNHMSNCVNLNTGTFDFFDNDTMVEVLDAEMVVK